MKNKKSSKQRLNNAIGQLQAIADKMDDTADPTAVLTQLKAARSAVDGAMSSYISEHLLDVLENCQDKRQTCQKWLLELLRTT